MAFYDEMSQIAREIMAEFKQGDVTYIELTPGDGPADSPGEPTESDPIGLDAVGRNAEFKYVDGTLIESTTTQLTFPHPSEGLNLDDLDYVIVDNERFKIIKKISIPPMGTPVVHKIFIGS